MKNKKYHLRTQISLSSKLRDAIDARRIYKKESLSEYIRKAIEIRIASENKSHRDLKALAERVIAKIPKEKSGWKNVKDISDWQRKLRREKGE
ncbi:MAG: hypothetical protein ACD_24C00459G0005 [uncultured bacterium]|uniref:Ribbon-helix-helix protein CopG domain-containing protein n=1 Tax=candidate division WWE3 bacterium RBG_16_37_10 TaxID=1802610 RepID=A0A1F4V2K3_UNCKA|nr:MAG: hypothetical protein ACD_24C00459G0005 [uncultured bacterium]OGC51411.1 MAG: hypothetical protein A2W32_01125 [candidate division WWE3 bacterium RBG_16_37_10]